MAHLDIFEDSSRKKFADIMKAIEKSGGKMVDPSDSKQLDSPLDQVYIDYVFDGKIITLHLEHYLGISLLSEEVDNEALEKIWKNVKQGLG